MYPSYSEYTVLWLSTICMMFHEIEQTIILYRLLTTRSTRLLVTCGAMELSCTRYGVWDTNHLRASPIHRYNDRCEHAALKGDRITERV